MADLITQPGPFEGEPRYVPYFWNLANQSEGESFWPLDDGEDENADPVGPEVTYFRVDAEESERFPELAVGG